MKNIRIGKNGKQAKAARQPATQVSFLAGTGKPVISPLSKTAVRIMLTAIQPGQFITILMDGTLVATFNSSKKQIHEVLIDGTWYDVSPLMLDLYHLVSAKAGGIPHLIDIQDGLPIDCQAYTGTDLMDANMQLNSHCLDRAQVVVQMNYLQRI